MENMFPDNFNCIICGIELNTSSRYSLCYNCIETLPFITDKSCVKCGAKVVADTRVCSDCKRIKRIIDKNYSAIVYDGVIRKVVHELKYNNKRFYAKFLGRILYDKFLEVLEEYSPDVIIPVPVSKDRKKSRGYNQVELMLEEFETHKDIIDPDAIIRIVDTPFQARLKREERLDNLKGVFKIVDFTAIEGKRILVIDDIFTTGSTMDECARILLGAGAKEVRSLTLGNAHVDRVLDKDKEEQN